MKPFHTLILANLSAFALLAGCGGGGGNSGAIGSRTARIQDLGDLAGIPGQTAPAYATAINNQGQVVGYSGSGFANIYGGFESHAFLWQNGKITDLGTLSGASANSTATAISNAGVIVGTSDMLSPTNETTTQSYSYDQACWFTVGGSPQTLPVSAGSDPSSPLRDSAAGVNDSGQICGTGIFNDPGLQEYTDIAYILANGKAQAAVPTPAGYAGSDAAGINNAGQITGTFAAFYSDGGTVGGGGTGGLSGGPAAAASAQPSGSDSAGKAASLRAADPNARLPYSRFASRSRLMKRDAGRRRMAGARRAARVTDAVYRHAFVYSKGAFTDLGALAGMSSEAAAINDAGQVVGLSYVTQDTSHAFLWQSGKMADLGTLGGPGSHANAIAPNGDVVGAADTAVVDTDTTIASSSGGPVYVAHAFIWRNGKMTDLNALLPASSGWVLEEATGINSKGQIVGFGRHSNLGTHPFLLTL